MSRRERNTKNNLQVDPATRERRYTALVLITNDFELNKSIPIWIVFKNPTNPGELSKPQEEANRKTPGAVITTTQNGMSTGASWRQVLEKFAELLAERRLGRPVLMTYDQARAHGQLSADYCRSKRWILRYVPAGHTDKCQPVDGAVSRRLKIEMRKVEELEAGSKWLNMANTCARAWAAAISNSNHRIVEEFTRCGFLFDEDVSKLKPELRKLYDPNKFREMRVSWEGRSGAAHYAICPKCKAEVLVSKAAYDLFNSKLISLFCEPESSIGLLWG